MSPAATPLSIQAPSAVVMVRPQRFTPNPETAADNRFQSDSGHAGDETAARAAASLTDVQRGVIERSARLLPLNVPTIELAGGSVRCMLAGIHLAPRRLS